MKRTAQLVLAASVAAAFVAVSAPAASANDCSDPKRPCGGCSLNLRATSPLELIECHPV